jgi:hypothetical protein
MSAASSSYDRPGEFAPEGERAGPWAGPHRRHDGFGPPLPLKLLGVGAAFWIAPPLGFAALGLWAWRAWSHNGGPGRCGHGQGWREFAERARSRHDWPRRSSGNVVLDERRRETLRAIHEEAEAYSDFESRRRAERDRETFDRFMAERGAADDVKRDEPKARDAH